MRDRQNDPESVRRDSLSRPAKRQSVNRNMLAERKRTAKALRESEEAARNYSRRLIEAQEAERQRISRELHDQVGQILTAVKMNLYALQHNCSQSDILLSISDNLKVIDEAVDQVRDLSADLRPLLLDDF